MYGCGLCTVEHRDFDFFQSPRVYGCVNSLLWCVKILKFQSSPAMRHCGDCDLVCTNFEIFQFSGLGALRCVCKHVENFKVPCVWVDLILKRLIIFGKSPIEIFYLYQRDFFKQKLIALHIVEMTAP